LGRSPVVNGVLLRGEASMELNKLTIVQVHNGLKKKEFSSLELTRDFLAKIEKEDKKIGAFINVSPEIALMSAKEFDEKNKEGGNFNFLGGIPIAIKDNILVEGEKCTAGSKILKDYKAPYDATVVQKIKKAGAVILGKTNMDEFAMGSSGENSAFFPTKNPHDLERVPGGSSSGSAAAVAADFAVCALGSDTGGSIRQPASFCGVVGFKPTYGAVSRYGLIAMASSLDQIGPIAKTVEDARTIFEVIKGQDDLDSTSVELKIKNQKSKIKINELRIGVPREYFIKGIDQEVENVVKKIIEKTKDFGVKIEEISLPHSDYALPCYYIIMASEVSANLARYDGIKFGHSLARTRKSPASLLDVYLESRKEGFGNEVKRRIMLGTYALSAGYYDAYYLRAQKVRSLIKKDFEEALKKVDLILTPTSPTVAFKFNEKKKDPLSMYLADIFTVSVNLAGLPAISIPCGKVDGLPVGLQIIGSWFEEEKIFDFAQTLEESLSFNVQRRSA